MAGPDGFSEVRLDRLRRAFRKPVQTPVGAGAGRACQPCTGDRRHARLRRFSGVRNRAGTCRIWPCRQPGNAFRQHTGRPGLCVQRRDCRSGFQGGVRTETRERNGLLNPAGTAAGTARPVAARCATDRGEPAWTMPPGDAQTQTRVYPSTAARQRSARGDSTSSAAICARVSATNSRRLAAPSSSAKSNSAMTTAGALWPL